MGKLFAAGRKVAIQQDEKMWLPEMSGKSTPTPSVTGHPAIHPTLYSSVSRQMVNLIQILVQSLKNNSSSKPQR
jgi:hypothetical protein